MKVTSFSDFVPSRVLVGLSMYSEESYHIVPGHGTQDMKETLEEMLFPCLDTTSLIDIGAQIGSGEISWDRGGKSPEALTTMP